MTDPPEGTTTNGLAATTSRAIGFVTAASGVGAIAAPRLTLRVLGARADAPAPFLFRVIGMFMAVSGGILVDASRASTPTPTVLRWAIAQKVGAATGVALGVRFGHYRRRALLVSLFDGSAAVALGWILARHGDDR